MEVAIISDNHSYISQDVLEHLDNVDEIWHAGDIGSLESIEPIITKAKFRAVYGNVDDKDIRAEYPLNQIFTVEGIKVIMTHIGGYPGRYKSRVSKLLKEEQPRLYVCGHSHICKVVKDTDLDLIHINPGAYGNHGFHKFRTIVKLKIKSGKMYDLRVIELGMRGKIEKDES